MGIKIHWEEKSGMQVAKVNGREIGHVARHDFRSAKAEDAFMVFLYNSAGANGAKNANWTDTPTLESAKTALEKMADEAIQTGLTSDVFEIVGNKSQGERPRVEISSPQRKMGEIQNSHFQSEDEVIAFAETWDQKDVTAIPAVIKEHFPELLDGPRFAESVPLDCRGAVFGEEVSISETNSLATKQNGFQVMAIDHSGIALVRHIEVWGYEGVDHSTYSTMPFIDAKSELQRIKKLNIDGRQSAMETVQTSGSPAMVERPRG